MDINQCMNHTLKQIKSSRYYRDCPTKGKSTLKKGELCKMLIDYYNGISNSTVPQTKLLSPSIITTNQNLTITNPLNYNYVNPMSNVTLSGGFPVQAITTHVSSNLPLSANGVLSNFNPISPIQYSENSLSINNNYPESNYILNGQNARIYEIEIPYELLEVFNTKFLSEHRYDTNYFPEIPKYGDIVRIIVRHSEVFTSLQYIYIFDGTNFENMYHKLKTKVFDFVTVPPKYYVLALNNGVIFSHDYWKNSKMKIRTGLDFLPDYVWLKIDTLPQLNVRVKDNIIYTSFTVSNNLYTIIYDIRKKSALTQLNLKIQEFTNIFRESKYIAVVISVFMKNKILDDEIPGIKLYLPPHKKYRI